MNQTILDSMDIDAAMSQRLRATLVVADAWFGSRQERFLRYPGGFCEKDGMTGMREHPCEERLSPDALFAELERQGILEQLYEVLIDSDADVSFLFDGPVPTSFMERLKAHLQRIGQTQTRFEQRSGKLSAACAEAGIPLLVLKGEALNALYSPQIARVTEDLDVFLEKPFRKRFRKLMAEKGYKLDWKGYLSSYHSAHVMRDAAGKPQHSVELHFTLKQSWLFPSSAVRAWEQRMRAHARPLGNGMFQPSYEDQFLFLLAHHAKHQIRKAAGLRSLLEIAAWLRAYGDGMDWDVVLAWMPRLFPPAYPALLMRLFAWRGWWNPQDERVLDWLDAYPVGQATLEAALWDMLSAPYQYYRLDGTYGWDSFGWRYPWFLKHWRLSAALVPVEAVVRMCLYRVAPWDALRWTAMSRRSAGKRRMRLVEFGLLQ